MQENFVVFVPNYLRLAVGVFLATFYLRPRALLGAAAVLFSTYRSIRMAYQTQVQQQQRQQAAAAAVAASRAQSERQQLWRQAQQAQHTVAAAAAAPDPNEQAVTALATVVTWLLVAYTRCLPILLLGAVAALVAVLLHCALRRAPSEYRYKGRLLLGYTWRQVLGRGGLEEQVLAVTKPELKARFHESYRGLPTGSTQQCFLPGRVLQSRCQLVATRGSCSASLAWQRGRWRRAPGGKAADTAGGSRVVSACLPGLWHAQGETWLPCVSLTPLSNSHYRCHCGHLCAGIMRWSCETLPETGLCADDALFCLLLFIYLFVTM
jgi:hypothetical protein